MKKIRPIRLIVVSIIVDYGYDIHNIILSSKEWGRVLAKYKDSVKVIPIGLDKTTYPEMDAERIEFWREKLGSKFFYL